MTLSLTDHETGAAFDGHYAKALAKLQKRLERIQVAHAVRGRRAVVMFEGWDAAGKGGIIERLTAGWDPRNFAVHPIAAPSPAEKAAPFLDRFQRRLPPPGRIAIFRSELVRPRAGRAGRGVCDARRMAGGLWRDRRFRGRARR